MKNASKAHVASGLLGTLLQVLATNSNAACVTDSDLDVVCTGEITTSYVNRGIIMKSTTVVLVAALGLTLTGIMGCAANENSELASSEISSEAAVASEPVITVAAVAGHNSANDCWAIVNGSIYDLTQWISAHPGGRGPIESICGVNATAAFTNKHGGQGAPEARLASFKIGILG